MSEDERDYFRQRAEIEIEAAQIAEHPDAVRAHYLLAGYYLDLAYNPLAPPQQAGSEREWDESRSVTEGAAFA